MAGKKQLYALYRCEVCGFEHTMCFGPKGENGKPWDITTCKNDETKCSKREEKDRFDKNGKPKLPKKTSILIRSWKEKI